MSLLWVYISSLSWENVMTSLLRRVEFNYFDIKKIQFYDFIVIVTTSLVNLGQ